MRPLMQIKNCFGFTLIETVTVLVVIGIISAIVAIEYNENNTDLFTVEAGLKNHIRYAQSQSMFRDNQYWGIQINTKQNKYWLFEVDEGTNKVDWGDTQIQKPLGAHASPIFADNLGKTNNKFFPEELDISISSSGADKLFYLIFDNMGVPYYRSKGTLSIGDPLSESANLEELSANLTLTLSKGSDTCDIVITPETGFVP